MGIAGAPSLVVGVGRGGGEAHGLLTPCAPGPMRGTVVLCRDHAISCDPVQSSQARIALLAEPDGVRESFPRGVQWSFRFFRPVARGNVGMPPEKTTSEGDGRAKE